MKRKVLKSMKFTVNGTQYDRLEDMPESVRKMLDKDNNGQVDMVEQMMRENGQPVSENPETLSSDPYAIEDKSSGIKDKLLIALAIGVLVYLFITYYS